MDLSAKPEQLKISDFQNIDIEKSESQLLTPQLIETMSTFPVWDVKKNSNIFIFSISCGDSVDRFINDIYPRVLKKEPFILANILRHDEDLNVWTRIFKLNYNYRMVLINKIFHDSYKRGRKFSMQSIHKVIDDYMSSVPLVQIYSGYDTKKAALSGVLTSVALKEIYNVTTTPVVTVLK